MNASTITLIERLQNILESGDTSVSIHYEGDRYVFESQLGTIEVSYLGKYYMISVTRNGRTWNTTETYYGAEELTSFLNSIREDSFLC